jgi:hypothetical protein
MKVKSDTIAGAIIFVVTCLIFLVSQIRQVADSKYSMLVSESLLYQRSFALDRYVIPGFDPEKQIAPGHGWIYHLELVNGHLYYYFPPGSSVLSVPYVALMNLFGISAANSDGTYSKRGDAIIQCSLAAILMAAYASLIFFTSRLLLPLKWSLILAVGGALGTQVWSTASRALWSDTWGILLIGVVVYLLLAHETAKHSLRPVLLASLLAWSYFVRPTNSLPIVAVTIYMIAFHRRLLLGYFATGIIWLALFVAYSWSHFGQLLPNYYLASRLNFETFGKALATNLISPSRGLLVFVPVLIFVAYLLIRYAKSVASRRLLLLSLSVIASHLIVVSAFPHWWAGHSYGPRFTTGLVPWFVLLGILAVKARLTRHEGRTWKELPAGLKAELALGLLLLVSSVVINMRGATSNGTKIWNSSPVDVDVQPERVWDWAHPQFLSQRHESRCNSPQKV